MSSLSVSQIGEWLSCRYRWKLGYVNLLRPKEMRPAITFGSIVHQGLETGFRGGDDQAIGEAIVEAIDQQNLTPDQDEWDDLYNRAFLCTKRGLTTFSPSEWEVAEYEGEPAVELHLEVPLPGWDSFQCYIDLILRHKPTGGLWLVDHKIRRQFAPLSAEETNLQMNAYQYAAAFRNLKTVGTITHQISSEPESIPKLNQNGEMSRAKIKCSWVTYRQALIDNGLDPDDYVDMAEKLNSEFVRTNVAHRTEAEITNVWNNIVLPVARDMRETLDRFSISSVSGHLPGGTELPRIFNHRECSGCLFKSICLADLRDDDVEFVIRTDYERKQRRWSPKK